MTRPTLPGARRLADSALALFCLVAAGLFSGSVYAGTPVAAGEVATIAETAGTPELVPVPDPLLERLEPAARKRIAEARAAVAESVAALDDAATDDAREAARAETAAAYGELGRLYLFFELFDAAGAAFDNAAALAPQTFEWLYYLGVVHDQTGDFPAAVEVLERAARLRPDDAPTRVRLGDALRRLGRTEEAATAYERALELDPEAATAEHGLGLLAAARGDARAAVEHFERVLVLQPASDAVYHPLAMAHRRLGDLDAARAALKTAGTGQPTHPDPLMQSLIETAGTPRSYLVLGNRARRRGLLPLALRFYRKAVELDPTHADALYDLGALLARMGAVDEATELFRRALEQDPEDVQSHFNLAMGLRLRGELGQAAEHFRRVVELDPGDLDACLELAATLHALGREDASRRQLDAVWEAATAEEGADVEILIRLARYRRAAGDAEGADAATAEAERRAAGAEDRARVLLLRAEEAKGRFDLAAAGELLQRAASTAPELPAARRALGEHLLEAGRSREAAAELVAASELAPGDAELAAAAGKALAAAGRHGEARTLLEESFRRLPESRALAAALARLLATAPDPALRDGEQALRWADRLWESRRTPENGILRAMALAAAGRRDEAVAFQERLIHELGRSGAPETLLARLRADLERYREGRTALPRW